MQVTRDPWYIAAMASKSVRILDILAQAGSRGMRFSAIQQALWEMTYPVGGDRPWEARSSSCRGYWCTNLMGGPFYHRGLLRFFATKGPDGLWRRNGRSHMGHPWAVLKDPRAHGFRVEPRFVGFYGYK